MEYYSAAFFQLMILVGILGVLAIMLPKEGECQDDTNEDFDHDEDHDL